MSCECTCMTSTRQPSFSTHANCMKGLECHQILRATADGQRVPLAVRPTAPDTHAQAHDMAKYATGGCSKRGVAGRAGCRARGCEQPAEKDPEQLAAGDLGSPVFAAAQGASILGLAFGDFGDFGVSVFYYSLTRSHCGGALHKVAPVFPFRANP